MGRKILRVLKWTLLPLLGLVLVVAVVLGVVYKNPQLVLKTSTAKWALQKYMPHLLEPTIPDDFEFRVTSPEWGQFHVSVKGSNFCASVEGTLDVACFDAVDLSATVNHQWPAKADLVEVGPITLTSAEITMHDTAKDPKKPKVESGPSPLGISRDLHVLPVYIHLKKVRVSHLKAFPVATDVYLRARTLGDDRAEISLSAKAASSASESLGVDGKVLIEERKSFDGDVKISTRLGTMKTSGAVNLKVGGDLTTGATKISGDGSIFGPPPYLNQTTVRGLNVDRKASGTMTVGADFRTEIKLPGGPLGHPVLLPMDLGVKGDFVADGSGTVAAEFIGRFLQPSDTTAKVDVKFAKGYAPDSAAFVAAVDLTSMKNLTRYLAGSPYEVPAPFRVLEGPIHLGVKGDWKMGPPQTAQAYPIELATRLTSPNQRLIMDGSGQFEMEEGKIPRLVLTADLKDVKLQAPDLDPISPIPFPASDPRIKTQTVTRKDFVVLDSESKNPAMVMIIDVKNSSNPIEILHPMFEPSLKFRLGYRQVETGAQMSAEFSPTTIKFLGRKVALRRLSFKTDSATDSMEFDGQVRMDRSGYTVLAGFSQKDKKTVLDLSSEPPLPQDDIISLLLFNEVSSELEPEESKSVEDTQSAVSKRALGFFSLWVLSSTPVESVNFDPSTSVYSAKVKLPGGVSAEVGSDWDQARQLELRKRLSRRWAVTTGVKTDKEGDQSQESFIEWFYRY